MENRGNRTFGGKMPKLKTAATLAVVTAVSGAIAALTGSSTANAATGSAVTSVANGFVTGHGWGDNNRHHGRQKVRIWIHNNNQQSQRQHHSQKQKHEQNEGQFPFNGLFNE
ncbi:hypothetical protein OHA25_19470 [Nonomuraea sp. NBC_00507]|uniref:hypothetical protein n=1 Tax=Nonomuraea sp. NBC_00507 TaxID=2976002 RepID=UPI002E1979DA